MLHRPLSQIYDNIRDYFVYREDGLVTGCVALHVLLGDPKSLEGLGEIRSMAVWEESQGRGVARRLFQACLDEVETVGLSRIILVTYIPDYFKRLGFQKTEKESLHPLWWRECFECPEFNPPNPCRETAMVLSNSQLRLPV